ncbi:Ark/Prk/Nak family serine/threonine-protein kinase Ecym_3323 [Eremothecium cymbalariae DBVPG|uniref:non-specific serine/threonine protein kinase n=1 Tax=Eremothecium cymbalariae (strain CBS 270.75 / DBVPG 7215 / KCTC 17166 / NRRL Y-17582) TaxID=931890 RepID=G8JRP4_ERECY|nr:Hypothetical protein Ecym_3323 [Eremothecium cymbalariae DBVPG\
MNQLPQDSFQPGTVLTVGSHKVKVVKYLTSGGFAQIYCCEVISPDSKVKDVACLKRVHVPDKQSLNTLRAEVDAMKLLRGNKHIVSYIDSHASKSVLNNGSYEVVLLMEYCSRGGLISFMNTRLQDRLKEFEVLRIMNQVVQGILAMHALQPPLIHRDIKIENVLIAENGDCKVCDFGSVCGVIRPPKNTYELSYVQHDILKNTTAQYRAPEMIDLYRGFSVDEKSDIWALGVFLYKLCYYTTPFEKTGEVAILKANFQFPSYPQYSNRLKNLITVMLAENPIHRPNSCQVLEEVCRIQGQPCPVKNFYLERSLKQQIPSQLRHSVSQPMIAMNPQQAKIPIVIPQVQNSVLPSNTMNMGYVTGAFQPASQPNEVRGDTALRVSKAKLLSTACDWDKTQNFVPGSNYNSKASVESGHLPTSSLPTPRSSVSPVRSGRGNINKIIAANPINIKRPVYVDSEMQTTDLASLKKANSRPLSLSLSSLPSQESFSLHYTGISAVESSQQFQGPVTFDKNNLLVNSKSNTGDSKSSSPELINRTLRYSYHAPEPASWESSEMSSKKLPYLNAILKTPKSLSAAEVSESRRSELERDSLANVPINNEYAVDPDSGGYHPSSGGLVSLLSTKNGQVSIQKRVHLLLANSDAQELYSSTNSEAVNSGNISVGNEELNSDDNIKPEKPPVMPVSRSKSQFNTPSVVKFSTKNQKKPPEKPFKPVHLRPTPPPKPAHLKSPPVNKKRMPKDTKSAIEC